MAAEAGEAAEGRNALVRARRRHPAPGCPRCGMHWLVALVGGLGIAAHGLVVPERWYEASYDSVEVFSLAAMVWAVRRHRPRPGRPWWLLTAGLALLVVGDVVYNALARINGEEVFPSVADALYLTSYGVLSAGLIAVMRARGYRRDGTALIDAGLVILVAAAFSWVYLIDPSWYADAPVLDRVVSATYPLGDLVLLGYLARLLISRSWRTPSEGVLVLGIGLLVVADVAYARLALTGDYAVGSWLDAVYHVSYLCLAVAAAHPSMRALATPGPDVAGRGRSRVWLLTAVALVLPAFAAAEATSRHGDHASILAAASAGAFFLLAVRTSLLNTALSAALAERRDALERERTLRELGTALVAHATHADIGRTACEFARRLGGPGTEAVVLGRDVAGELEGAVGSEIRAGRPAVVAPEEAPALRACLADAAAGRLLFVTPLGTGDGLAGAVVVAPGSPPADPDRVMAAYEVLGSTVSLALDAADLAEALVERRSEERFAALVRNSSDILVVLEPDAGVRFVSPSVSRVLGWEEDEVLHRRVVDFLHPDDWPAVHTALVRALAEPGTHGPVGCRIRHKDAGWRFVEAVGTRLVDEGDAAVVVNVRDVTERVVEQSRREALEAQLQHAQRLDSLGRLAGGVAHDFKNLLSVISLTVDMLADEPEAGAWREDLGYIRDAAAHGVALSQQLLLFSRADPPATEPLDVVVELERVAEMLRRTVPASVTIEIRPAEVLPPVLMNPSRFDQAVVNLVLNARDALPDGGLVVIACRELEGAEAGVANLDDGRYVEVAVSDNGTGMPAGVAARAFDPFFTTKGPGEGTGLGLSIVHGVVAGVGGAASVDSEAGTGTTVRLFLPVAGPSAGGGRRRERPRPGTARGAGQRVLVVEDEEAVRALAARTLASAGYRTLEAAGAAEALELLDRPGARVDVVLTDVIMPGMSGSQFAERLAGSHPGLPVVFMSGYTGGDLDLGDPSLVLLEKPFSREELLDAITSRLDGRPRRRPARGRAAQEDGIPPGLHADVEER